MFSEAKGTGFDVKIMKQVLKARRMKPEESMEFAELLEIYFQALGMTPESSQSSSSAAYAAGELEGWDNLFVLYLVLVS